MEDTGVCPELLDVERCIALILGLRARDMVESLPVQPEEEQSRQWLTMDVFSGGLETQALSQIEDQLTNEHGDPLHQHSSASVSRFFLHSLIQSKPDREAATFLSLVGRYCRQKHMILPVTDRNPDHPVERFGRLFMASLLKLHDLVQIAVALAEQECEGFERKDQSPLLQLPPAIADVCKMVHDAKISLVKAHQESSCSYDEICGPAVERCLFLIDHIRSPLTNIHGTLHRHQLGSMHTRWHSATQKVLQSLRKSGSEELSGVRSPEAGTPTEEMVVSVKERLFQRQLSREQKGLSAMTQEVRAAFDPLSSLVVFSLDCSVGSC